MQLRGSLCLQVNLACGLVAQLQPDLLSSLGLTLKKKVKLIICNSVAVKCNCLQRICFLFAVLCRFKSWRRQRDNHTYKAPAVKPWGSDIYLIPQICCYQTPLWINETCQNLCLAPISIRPPKICQAAKTCPEKSGTLPELDFIKQCLSVFEWIFPSENHMINKLEQI